MREYLKMTNPMMKKNIDYYNITYNPYVIEYE